MSMVSLQHAGYLSRIEHSGFPHFPEAVGREDLTALAFVRPCI
jgi:hypothetical protein